MDDEKFRLTAINKILIFITIVCACAFAFSLVILIFELNDKADPVPDLNVIKGKTSTTATTTTTLETTTTITTTTIKNPKSPYYDLNVDDILSDPLYSKSKGLTKEEAITILKGFYEIMNQIYEINDNSLLNIRVATYYAKPNEKDKIKDEDGNEYGIIYNGEKLFNKLMTGNAKNVLLASMYKDKRVFIRKDNEYYRIKGDGTNNSMVLVSLDLSSYNNQTINGKVKYYESDYQNQGYTAPQYKTVNIRLLYNQSRWVLTEYRYPIY